VKTKQQIWIKSHKEHLNEYSRKWRKANPEKSKIIKRRYEVKRKAKRKRIREEKEKQNQELYF